MPRLISFFDVEPIFNELASGQLILTANQRLASRIQTAFASACQHRGAKVVSTPRIYSLSTWMDLCWQRMVLCDDPLAQNYKLLNSAQELLLWEQMVSESDVGAALLRPVATARQVAAAYRLLIEWQQDISDEACREVLISDEDAAVLLQWIDQFTAYCQHNNWLASVKLAEVLITAFKNTSLSTEGTILGIGFDSIAPLYSALLSAAGDFQLYEPKAKSAEVCVVQCDDASREVQAAAVWAKGVLKNDPDARVGIVIPDLAQQRQRVQRIFQEVFEPGFNRPAGKSNELVQRRNLPFNFSAGYPLVEAPVIAAALDALHLALPVLELETLETICQSPFYCLDDAFGYITVLVTLLRTDRSFTITGARFRQLAEKALNKAVSETTDLATKANENSQECSEEQFCKALQDIATMSRQASFKQAQSSEYWLQRIVELLQLIGWPGKRQLDSIEYQQVSQWQKVLKLFAMQDAVSIPISFTQAISRLKNLLTQQIFQPQTADSALQILGTLEAAGLQFSHLWLQSMAEKNWPAPPSPNPLLPVHLQRQLNMPHATAARELTFSQNISQRFIHSANNLVVSFPAVMDDNPAAVSSLFAGFPQIKLIDLLKRPLEQLLPVVEIRRRHLESGVLESLSPGQAPELGVDEVVRGGSALFASQAACPFKAFAQHRLGLKALDKPGQGLNAADRGSILHRALELLWQRIKSQDELLALDQAGRELICRDSSNYALNEWSQKSPVALGLRFHELEVKRLTTLLLAWLDIEEQRTSFTVVSTEGRTRFQFQQLELETRIDRIDRLGDDSLLVIDYKTSNVSTNRWWGDRPDEPQLPLYQMLAERKEEKVSGIGFAQLRADGCELKGVGDEHSLEPKVQWQTKTSSEAGVQGWEQLQQHWNKVLMALAQDFISGKSDVDPKRPAQTCQFCHYSSLCRIEHTDLPESIIEDADELTY